MSAFLGQEQVQIGLAAFNESIIEIALNAPKGAIDSAGITPKEIQAGYISNVFGVADKQVPYGTGFNE